MDMEMIMQNLPDKYHDEINEKITSKILEAIDEVDFKINLKELLESGMEEYFNVDYFYDLVMDNEDINVHIGKYVLNNVKKSLKLK